MAREYSKIVLFMAQIIAAGFEAITAYGMHQWSLGEVLTVQCSLVSLSCGPARSPQEDALQD